MAIVTTDDKHYKAISEAIREYVLEEQFKPSEMADKIRLAYMYAENVGYNNGESNGRIMGMEQGHVQGLLDGKRSLLQASKYMNATVSGEVVAVKDVSPVEHELAVKVSRKNLLPPPKPQTKNGITITANEDGSYTLNGTATADIYLKLGSVAFQPGETYVLSGISGGNAATYSTYFYLNSEYAHDIGKGAVFTVPADGALAATFYFSVKKGVTLDGVIYKPQVELGSTATAYAPYIADLSQVRVTRYSKNLCRVSGANTKTSNGITYKNNGDGTITVNGTATADSYYDVVTAGNYPPKLPLKTILYISGCPSTGSSSTYYIDLPWVGWFDYGKGGTGNISNTALQNNWRQCIRINVKSGTVMDNVVFKPQVEIGGFSDYTRYYADPASTANEDGTVDVILSLSPSMTLITDTDGVLIDCSYLRDIDTYIDNLTMSVAMTGGD